MSDELGDLTNDERVQLIRTLGSMAMNAELSNSELEFYNYLIKFFERMANKHYNRGYEDAMKDHKRNKK